MFFYPIFPQRFYILGEFQKNMDEETKELMKEHEIDEGTAERAQEFIDEGIDESDAVDLAEEGL